MKKLASKLGLKPSTPSIQLPDVIPPITLPAPTPLDIIRYRYHHGVNAGSFFVLERWLFNHTMFPPQLPGPTQNSEWHAVKASFDNQGLSATKAKWEKHWQLLLDESQMEWFVREARGTSIRLPIGYFTLGEEWCRGTPFEPYAGVYAGAWTVVRAFVGLCRRWGVGVLIDFHAVYGGANPDAHSGSGSGKAELWTDERNLSRTREALVWIAREAKGMDGVVGIQVVNEARWCVGREREGMYAWYGEVVRGIGEVDEAIPVYLSDAWDLGACARFVNTGSRVRGRMGNSVVVDHHCYYTFDEKHRSCTPREIIERVAHAVEAVDGERGSVVDGKRVDVVIGEWSCVLDGKTWSRVGAEEKPGLVREFGQVQSKRWATQTSGSYFWTWRMEWMDGGEWGFVEQVKKGNISAPTWLLLSAHDVESRIRQADGVREEKLVKAMGEHGCYWDRACPGKRFHHELFGYGFGAGWDDARGFFGGRKEGLLGGIEEGGDRIGVLEGWVGRRLGEVSREGGFGEWAWEWEQGFRRGVREFEGVVGI